MMPGPRVAYILLWFPEPSQTFILEEVNTLVRLGLPVAVYTLYGARRAYRIAGMAPAAAPVTHLGVSSLGVILQDVRRVSRTWGPEAATFLRRVLLRRWRTWESLVEAAWAAAAGVHLARVFPGAGIGHIHAPWADGPATAAWVASHLSGIPFSFSARARDLYPPDGALRDKMAAADLVRTNTRANRVFLTGLAPQEAAKVVNIYNGVAFTPPSAPVRPQPPPFRLLAIGRLMPKKGFAVLLDACRLLAQGGMDFRLTVAGEGPERRKLQGLIQAYGLEGRVKLPGFIPHRQVPSLLAAAHLMVMPSQQAPSGDRDGIPNVVLEALLHEVPVVATAFSGLPEVIHPGETGWLAPPGDPEALAQAIAAALADPAEGRRRARAGRDLVAREFDSRKNYGHLKACYERLMGGERRSV